MARTRVTAADRRAAEEAAAKAAHEAFLVSVPRRLFELQELAKTTPHVVWTVELTMSSPVLKLTLDNQDSYWESALSDESEEWVFDETRNRLMSLKAEHDRQVARRNAAAELRKSLSKDQLDLLREFGC